MVTSKEYLQIGFRGSEEYRRSIQQAALDRGLKVQRLLELAVEQFVRQDSGEVSSSSSGISEQDAEVARKFLKWYKKQTNSPTHKGLVDLMTLELSREK